MLGFSKVKKGPYVGIWKNIYESGHLLAVKREKLDDWSFSMNILPGLLFEIAIQKSLVVWTEVYMITFSEYLFVFAFIFSLSFP